MQMNLDFVTERLFSMTDHSKEVNVCVTLEQQESISTSFQVASFVVNLLER